jgi:hypothetical protein
MAIHAREVILLVDDDPGVRLVAGRMLRDAGYAVSEAADGLLKSGTGLARSSRRASSWSVWFDQRWRSRSGSSGLYCRQRCCSCGSQGRRRARTLRSSG